MSAIIPEQATTAEETLAIAPVIPLDPRTYASPARPAPWSQAPARAA